MYVSYGSSDLILDIRCLYVRFLSGPVGKSANLFRRMDHEYQFLGTDRDQLDFGGTAVLPNRSTACKYADRGNGSPTRCFP
jgi:hypothetical protein